jgi:hypothetical protein
MSPRIITLFLMACVCGLGAGCASQGPIPTEQLTTARTLVAQADKADAQRYAPADLQRAHDELASAEQAVNKHSTMMRGASPRTHRWMRILPAPAPVAARLSVPRARSTAVSIP